MTDTASPLARLGEATLSSLPLPVERPRYDRRAVRAGVVHLGIGAFHRAHQAVVFDDCLAAGELDWGVRAASLRSAGTRDALAPQDWLYTLALADGAERRLRVIGAVQEVIVAPENPARLLDALADPGVRIVTLTITEKGYLRSRDGGLDFDDPGVRRDIAGRAAPSTAFGFLAAAIARRRAEGAPPFTILSCDNLPANGRTLRSLLLEFIERADPATAAFAEAEIACPSSMVDRIVPATTAEDRAAIAAELGAVDAWPVIAEPYFSWIVEDDFPSGRPDFATPGVELVGDVAPYELMKLRLLNGAHSTLAYAGLLLGHSTVAGGVADPAVRALVDLVWREAAATLPEGEPDAAAFTAALAVRFGNAALRHRLAQIATDGSQKLPQRIVAPALEIIAAGARPRALGLALACWIEALRGRARGDFDFGDPRRDELDALLAGAPDASTAVRGVLRELGQAPETIWTDALAAEVEAGWRLVRDRGLRDAMAAVAGGEGACAR